MYLEAAHKKTEVKEESSRTTDNVALISYTKNIGFYCTII